MVIRTHAWLAITAVVGALLVVVTPASADPPGPPYFGPVTAVTALNGVAQSPASPAAACPAGAVMTATTLSVAADPGTGWLSGAQIDCASLGSATGVSLGSTQGYGSIVGFRGTPADPDNTHITTAATGCPTGSVVVGIQGRTGFLVNLVQLICAVPQTDGTLSSATTTTTPVGSYGGSDRGQFLCPTDEVVTGLEGNAGQDLNELDIDCQRYTFAAPDPQPANSSWPLATLVGGNSDTNQAMTDAGQQLWYKFAVAPDSRVTVTLDNLGANEDLAVFKDIGQQFTSLTGTQDLTQLTASNAGDAFNSAEFSPSAFTPSAFTPSAFTPSAFTPSAFTSSLFTPSAFTPSAFTPSAFTPSAFTPSAFTPSAFTPSVDLPSAFTPSAFTPSAFTQSTLSQAFSGAQTASLIGVSANDGTAPESVTVQTWNNTGNFYVRVSGRDGAFSPQPFHLGVATSGGPCGVTLNDYASDPTLTGTPGPTTVIVTNPGRLPGSGADKSTLASTLSSFAGQVGGTVVDVSGSQKVTDLQAQADANSGCPYAQNLTAQAIRDIVNSYRSSALKYVVLVGGDHAIPFFRYADSAGLGPESGYVPPVADGSASQASLRSNDLLSQDAYGARIDVSIKGQTLPVPDLAVGRLVETAAEITATVQQYLTRNGAAIQPTSTLTTGYDFLADAAHAVATDFAAGDPSGTNDTLITDADVSPDTTTVGGVPSPRTSWTATDLRKALFGSRHDLVFLAGHFSANNALAADYSTTITTDDLAAAPAANFANTLVFSAGCHSGYNIVDSDGIPQVTDGLDWAQAMAQKGATLIAGTGYQYGDTDFVKYSEELYSDFAHVLRYGTGAVAVGAALLQAKQDYLNHATTLQGIDQKALLEATLFGLPMTGVNFSGGRISPPSSPTQASPAPISSGPGQVLGLSVSTLDVAPTLTNHTVPLTSTAGGSNVNATYVSGPDGVDSNPGEPTVPLVSTNVTAPDGSVLRGVGFRSGTYSDSTGITPLTGAATTETASVHSPFVSSAFFPNRLATPNYFGALSGSGGTQLQVTPAQYRSDTPGSLTDTQRLYSDIGLSLYYSSNVQTYASNTPARAAAPSITGVQATSSGNVVTFQTHVVGDPSAGIQQVWVTYTGETGTLHGTWASLDLTQDATDSTLWSGSLSLPDGQSAADLRFEVQAVNGVAEVGADDNQGSYYIPGVNPAAPSPTATPTTLVLSSGGSGQAVYGASIPVSATLSPASANTPITFDLGGSEITAFTNTDGVAAASLPVSSGPGQYVLTAAFSGDASRQSSASAGQPVTVSAQPTSLALVAGSGGALGVTATLTGLNGQPLTQKSVVLVARSGSTVVAVLPLITDRRGRVTVPAASLPTSPFNVQAYFGSSATPLLSGTADLSDPTLAPATSIILNSPALTTTSLPNALIGGRYLAPLGVAGGATLTATGLPPGLSLRHPSSGWMIAGTASRTAGLYRVAITATNGVAAPTITTLTLMVGYQFTGFTAPVNDPAGTTPSIFPAGSSVPVRFGLSDAGGAPITLREALAVVVHGRARLSVSAVGTTTARPNERSVKGVKLPVSTFFYDPLSRQFFFYAAPSQFGFTVGKTYSVTAVVTSAAGDVVLSHSVVVGFGRLSS